MPTRSSSPLPSPRAAGCTPGSAGRRLCSRMSGQAGMERRSYKVKGSDGLALRVLEWGPETAPPVVMLHGIRGYAQTFATLAGALLPHFRTIAYDQRGRGESDWDPARQYYTGAYVRDLEAG